MHQLSESRLTLINYCKHRDAILPFLSSKEIQVWGKSSDRQFNGRRSSEDGTYHLNYSLFEAHDRLFQGKASDNSSPCLIRCLMRSESNGISEMGREFSFFLAELRTRNPLLDESVV
ncbi:hypothetical protein CEXT_751111 [Caerostris extrusa]|uniref:Uncharacterized protein n=1 Tax=Caerostris extrusa TaxID=172846 RepID=A0AAV4U0X3_CAEEX|nr:hypothetical protein CEXT_751111 [Caerostris extrusa]